MFRFLIISFLIYLAVVAVKRGYIATDFPFIQQAQPDISTALVERVIDGDTIEIGGERRVRLKGIDCPESNQAYGDVAKMYLVAAIEGTQVDIETHYTDRYDRMVGVVYYGDTNINRFMVEQGLCWAYRQYVDDKELFALEQQAKIARIGLWSQPSPTPPWDYRRKDKRAITSVQ